MSLSVAIEPVRRRKFFAILTGRSTFPRASAIQRASGACGDRTPYPQTPGHSLFMIRIKLKSVSGHKWIYLV